MGLPVGMCVEVGQSCGQAVGWRWETASSFSTGSPRAVHQDRAQPAGGRR
jgi:hypothetical protein